MTTPTTKLRDALLTLQEAHKAAQDAVRQCDGEKYAGMVVSDLAVIEAVIKRMMEKVG